MNQKHFFKKNLFAFIIICCLIGFTTCQKDKVDDGGLPDLKTVSISNKVHNLLLHDTYKFDIKSPVKIDPSLLSWKSDKNEVIGVDKDGTIHADKEGTAIVSLGLASSDEIIDSCEIDVQQLKLKLSQTDLGLLPNDQEQLTVSCSPNIDKVEYEWTSSDTKVATVVNGLVTAVAMGDATVSVCIKGQEDIKAECKVKVRSHKLILDKTDLNLLLKQEASLTVECKPEIDNAQYTWTSSDATVATVDNTGHISAISAGTADIKVSLNGEDGVEAHCKLTVSANAHKLTINKTVLNLQKGKDETLTVECTPKVEKPEYVWTSSNTKVATVGADGKVTAVDNGEATISVCLKGEESAKAECKVTVSQWQFKLNINSLKLNAGDKKTLTVTHSQEVKDEDIVWHTTNGDVASVSKKGELMGLGQGEAVITASWKLHPEISDQCTVEVTGNLPTGDLELDKHHLSICQGEVLLLRASKPAQSSAQVKAGETYNWISSDQSVATVDNQGIVTAVSTGNVIISVSLPGATRPADQCKFEIQPKQTKVYTFETNQDAEGFFKTGYIVCYGNISIAENSTITTLKDMGNLLKVLHGSFYIQNTQLQSLDGLKNLQEVDGTIMITNTSLRDLSGFNALKKVEGSITFTNVPLQNLHGLENLEEILNGYLNIQNSNISSLEGLDKLRKIKGSFASIMLSTNQNLNSLKNISNIDQLDGDLSIIDSPLLTSLAGLDHITPSGNIIIRGCNLNSLQGLNGLTKINGYLNLSDEIHLKDISALHNLTYLGGDISLGGNGILKDLTSLKGLESLTQINGSLDLSSLPNLQDISALKSLTSINGNLSFAQNCPLTSLNGLQALTEIKGNLDLSDLSNLHDITALKSLTTIDGDLEFNSKCSLTSLDGLQALTHVEKDLDLRNLEKLQTINALNNLQSVGGDLNIGTYSNQSPITDMSNNFSNLESVNGKIDIEYFKQLTELPSFPALQSAQKIDIEHCDQLTNFCPLKDVLSKIGNIEFDSSSNGYNPSKAEVMDSKHCRKE